ncbi:MAG: hypothetical protein A3A51_05095 [Candidatus Levybacteria bacterium RIFCSPLOWO2_01_FULL_39_10]|nr:MAG: hypothetical protein A3A51_05095 [Candidatus Levybacteria bacterium RIFCSPLOWO2_01_FULL_39_10]
MQIYKNNQNISSRLRINNKKLFLAFGVLITLIIIIASLIFIFNDVAFEKVLNRKTEAFISQVDKIVKEESGAENTPEGIQNIYNILEDSSTSKEEKYQSLQKLSFYFSDAYSQTHDPKFKDYSINVIGKYAEENFPSLYNPTDFDMACADPVCGQELTPEIKDILDLIKNSDMANIEKRVIVFNLEVAGYMPEDQIDYRGSIFSMSYFDLISTANPTASRAAKLLKDYAESKYNLDITIIY